MKQLACAAFSLLAVACATAPARPPAADPAIAGAIARIAAAADRSPDLPHLRYLLATYHDRAGDAAAVLRTLGELEAGGWRYGVTPDDFPNTRSSSFDAIAHRLNSAEPRVANSSIAFTIPQRDLIAEGIASDPSDGSLYVGSIYQRKIVRITPDGTVSDFTAADDGTLAVLGLKVDPAHRILWAATWASQNMRGYEPLLKGRAELVAYDLRTGARQRVVPSAPAGAPSLLNDLAILEDGTVLVTDSERGALLRLSPGATAFDLVARDFRYPNGIVLLRNTHALVDDFIGLWRVDLSTGERTRVTAPPGIVLGGIDGMSLDGDALVAVQNGVGRPRVIRITLNEDASAATDVSTLENAHAALEIPTTGTILGRNFYFIANAQLRAFNPDHTIWPLARLKPTVILKVPLE